MRTDQKRANPGRDEIELERLLREFFAAEMPAALRDATVQPPQRAVLADAGTARPSRRPAAGALGLTAVLASLMLALSAALWTPRTAEQPTGAGGHAGRADPTGAGAADTAADGPRSVRPAGPVEGRSRSGIPVGSPGGDGEHGNQQFPELDIRIIPIEEDR